MRAIYDRVPGGAWAIYHGDDMGVRTAVATVSLYLVSGVAASRWKNVTVYHVHPSSNLHGDLRDMNSGDQAGDVSSSLQAAARLSRLYM